MAQIKGYRQLNDQEVALINETKKMGDKLNELTEHLLNQQEVAIDLRWLSIGRTHLQQGMMALARSIAQPDGF